MKNLGDFATGKTVRGIFNSRSTSGAPITLAGSPALAVYKDGGTTQVTTGATLTVDFDAVTGTHLYEIVTTDAFYAAGSDFSVVLTAGTVDGVSVVGTEVAQFSIENRSVAKLQRNAFLATELAIGTVTSQTELILTGGPANDADNVLAIFFDASASNTPVVAEGSYVGSTGTLTLTAATDITLTTSDTVTLAALGVSSNEVTLADGAITVAKIADGAITAAKIAANAITSTTIADGTLTAAKIAADAITVAKIADNAITAAKIAADAITESKMSAVATLIRLAAGAATGTVGVTDNGTTLTLSFKDTDGTTEIANVTYTKASGARTRNS